MIGTFCQVWTGIGARNGHAVVVDRVGRQRPPVVLTGLDQVEIVAASGAMLDLPQLAVGREGPVTTGPGFGGRHVRARKRIGRITGAVLAFSVSAGGSITGTVAAPILPVIGLPSAGFPSRVRRRILPKG
jgi:hypothetical protein